MPLHPTDDLGMNSLMSVKADYIRVQSTSLMGSFTSSAASRGETRPWLNHLLVGKVTKQAYYSLFSYACEPEIKWNELLAPSKYFFWCNFGWPIITI